MFIPVFLSIKIVLLLCFICILLGLNFGNTILAVSFGLVICILFGFLNVYQLFKKGHIPKVLKIISGIVIIGIVAALAVIGFALDIISDFSVFAITIGVMVISIFIVYLLTSYTKSSK